MSMVHIFLGKESPKDTFAFKFSASPSLRFSFSHPTSAPLPSNRPFKRRRALSDIDGEGDEGRKKRRLRLHLITSRLSLPFSQPASNILNRGVNKIPVWGAKNKALSKNLLRKAAIMNRVRRRMDAARDFMRREQENTRERLSLREIVFQRPRCLDTPPPPSPFGLWNYDALDLEDEDQDLYQEEWCAGGGGLDRISTIYSDFNIMNPVTEHEDEDALDDYLDALGGIEKRDLPDTTPPALEEECVVEFLREDCQGEGFFVQIRD